MGADVKRNSLDKVKEEKMRQFYAYTAKFDGAEPYCRYD